MLRQDMAEYFSLKYTHDLVYVLINLEMGHFRRCPVPNVHDVFN